VLLLLIIVMRKRVALTVDLFYEAGRCMVHVPFLLLQPIWTFLVLALFWMGWVAVFGFLATAGNSGFTLPDAVTDRVSWSNVWSNVLC